LLYTTADEALVCEVNGYLECSASRFIYSSIDHTKKAQRKRSLFLLAFGSWFVVVALLAELSPAYIGLVSKNGRPPQLDFKVALQAFSRLHWLRLPLAISFLS
jgi:hypothetical protein